MNEKNYDFYKVQIKGSTINHRGTIRICFTDQELLYMINQLGSEPEDFGARIVLEAFLNNLVKEMNG